MGRNVLGISCGFFYTLVVIERSILEDSYFSVKIRRFRVLEINIYKIFLKICVKCNFEIYIY